VGGTFSTYTFADSFVNPVGTAAAKSITAVSSSFIGTMFTY